MDLLKEYLHILVLGSLLMHFVSMGRGFFVKDKEQKPHRLGDLSKWILKFMFNPDHFLHISAWMFFSTACLLEYDSAKRTGEISEWFKGLVSFMAGFYFKGKVEQVMGKSTNKK